MTRNALYRGTISFKEDLVIDSAPGSSMKGGRHGAHVLDRSTKFRLVKELSES